MTASAAFRLCTHRPPSPFPFKCKSTHLPQDFSFPQQLSSSAKFDTLKKHLRRPSSTHSSISEDQSSILSSVSEAKVSLSNHLPSFRDTLSHFKSVALSLSESLRGNQQQAKHNPNDSTTRNFIEMAHFKVYLAAFDGPLRDHHALF